MQGISGTGIDILIRNETMEQNRAVQIMEQGYA
jgi:hypothetical protein